MGEQVCIFQNSKTLIPPAPHPSTYPYRSHVLRLSDRRPGEYRDRLLHRFEKDFVVCLRAIYATAPESAFGMPLMPLFSDAITVMGFDCFFRRT